MTTRVSAPRTQAENLPSTRSLSTGRTKVRSSLEAAAPSAQIAKPHQLEAEAFCQENKRVILADDMGVGKTLPAIRASQGRTIVICPASVKQNWRNEILREKPDARVLILSGTNPSPIEADVDFVILNYDIADAWREYLIAWRPDTCIADEAHVCRNRQTARFQATLQIVWACNRRYLLTGTPIVNRPLDLVALINMLGKLKSVFGGWKSFVDRYCDPQKTQWCYDASGASNLDELHEILYREKIMLRRTKHEVLSLPQKTRTIVRVTVDPANLHKYVKAEQALAEEIKANPSLLRETSFEALAGVRHATGQCKIKPAIARIREILTTDQKLVVFAHQRSVREAIAAIFPAIAIILNAETNARDAQVALFQTSPAHRLFITSPHIGGLGITLTAASAVLIVEFDFTSAIMLQAEDRAHRLGQLHPVAVEYLYANATVDGFMLAMINRKQQIFDQTCDGLADPGYLLRLSKERR
jgi:SWI/SNF-related matrix-associated actin-dependent regulator of chromatin subfamily A-like protein 1